MTLRPCIVRGCPEYTTGTRCDRHQREHDSKRHAKRFGGRGGSSAAYKRARLEAFARDAFTCMKCLRHVTQLEGHEWLEAHHVDGNRENHALPNLQTMCSTCHRKLPKTPTPQPFVGRFA